MIGFSKDEFIPSLQLLTERIHRHGAKIAAQLNHSGKIAQEDVIAGRSIPVPSIPKSYPSDMFGLLTQDEIMNFIKAGGLTVKGLAIMNYPFLRSKMRYSTSLKQQNEPKLQILMRLKFMQAMAI
jgi:hypothetical protein